MLVCAGGMDDKPWRLFTKTRLSGKLKGKTYGSFAAHAARKGSLHD